MPAARKRLREGAPADAASTAIATLRDALKSRSDVDGSVAAPWRAAAADAGAPNADAYLCHLGRSIGDALQTVPVHAEAARAQLRSVRAALHSAVDARCDELEGRITAAESAKATALERELCAVDAVLELLRAERGAAAEAAESLGDADLEARHAELTARLEAAEARLLTLPTSVVEPAYIGLEADLTVLMASIPDFGQVVAPRAITAAGLSLEPPASFVRPGDSARLRFRVLDAQLASQSAAELEVSLRAAAAATRVEATLDYPGAAPQPLDADVSVDIPGRCVVVSVGTPLDAPVIAYVSVGSVTVSGQRVAGAEPLRILVRPGVRSPFRLQWSEDAIALSVCISKAGHVFVTQANSMGVSVFDGDGSPLSGMPAAGLNLSADIRWSAFAHSATATLLLADDIGKDSTLVAVDPMTRVVRWQTHPHSLRGCYGVAGLPGHDLCIVASSGNQTLFAHRLSDGSRVGNIVVRGLSGRISADPTTGVIFGDAFNVNDEGNETHLVYRASWNPDSGLVEEDIVEASGDKVCLGRLVAVVPPAPGKRVSHLVVGSVARPELLVLALPDETLVHTHTLAGMAVVELAADPWGEALAVIDGESKALHVLSWPLPGMPVLE